MLNATEIFRNTARVDEAYRILGASVIGPLHTYTNLPCQDACAFEFLPPNSVIVAVADGLGSACRSDVGAKLVVDSSIARVKQMLTRKIEPAVDLAYAVGEALAYARNALEEKAATEQCNLKDLACTIIVAALSDEKLCVAHVGDGAVVVKTAVGLLLASGPDAAEYVNEVVPLTSEHWKDHCRITNIKSGVQCLAVITDGCQRAALRKSVEGLQPFDGFFDPIFAYVQETEDTAVVEAEIRALLSSQKICNNSDDDKTLVVAVPRAGQ